MIGEHGECLSRFFTHNQRPFLYAAILAVLFVWLLATKLLKRNKLETLQPRTPDLEKPSARRANNLKAPERPPGVWTPIEFKRPDPAPYPDWDVYKTAPLPYRPFRHGPYHITMGLRTMQWDEWIELDNHYMKFHHDKAQRIKEKGFSHCRTAPEAMDGAIELLEELWAT